jgi:retinol dehydrogenase 14
MTEPTAVVTGASSGIGLYTALGLARAGMRVVMVGRDPARTEAARQFVAARWPAAPLETALADFAALGEVRRLAGDILAAYDRVDVLINNAGLFSPTCRASADGFELTFAVNHLAPFLLTNLLVDRLKASVPARIVNVASRAHRGQRLDLATLAKPSGHSTMRAPMAVPSCATSCSRGNWRHGSAARGSTRSPCIRASSRPASASAAVFSNWAGG